MARPSIVVVAEAMPTARAGRFRERFERVAGEAIRARGRFSCALTGGSTPTVFYPSLREAHVPWEHVHLFWGDERIVGPEHPDSNYRLARETFLADVPVPADQQHRIEGELENVGEVVTRGREALRLAAGEPPVFDVVHLGIGPDGHVASLFPGHPVLADPAATVEPVTDSPKPPPRRVTLTLPVLTSAREVWLFADTRKAGLVDEAMHDPRSTLPLSRVVREARNTVVWFVDDEAAAAVAAAR